MNTFYNNIKTETQKFPIVAGMRMTNGKVTDYKMRKIGYKVIEFTYDINPQFPDDKMLISQKEIKRVIK